MADELDDFFKNTKPPPPRRKLQAYAPFIRRCLRKQWSIRFIVSKLKEWKGLSVAPSTVCEFIKTQRRPGAPIRKAKPGQPGSGTLPEAAPATTTETLPARTTETAPPKSSTPKPPRKPRFNIDT